MHLKSRVTKAKGQTQEDGFCLLVYAPNGWAGPKLEARNSIWVSDVGGKAHVFEPSFSAFAGILAGNWITSGTALGQQTCQPHSYGPWKWLVG